MSSFVPLSVTGIQLFVGIIIFRISDLCKDYCGVLNEESIKKNFPLIYELLDEMLVRF